MSKTSNLFKMNVVHILIPLTILVMLFERGDALTCFQCNSTLDHNCQEMFNHDNPYLTLKSTECQMYNAKFCIKVTGLWGGIVGTHRFCSSRDLGDQCQDMRFPDHSRKYRGCVYTCTSDGCNSAQSVFAKSTTILSAIFFTVIALVLRR
ncbi:hypothetical protein ACF0H5_001244 [Mactra antiquata]